MPIPLKTMDEDIGAPDVAFVHIDLAEVVFLLRRQTGGILPAQALDAEWHSARGDACLGAVYIADESWRYVLLIRDRGGFYNRFVGGRADSRNDAFESMRRAAA
jgi:hypothetical protein